MKIAGSRVGVTSMRVDINDIRRRQQESVHDNIGAFGRGFKRDNRPKPIKSFEEKLFLKKKEDEAQKRAGEFFNKRANWTQRNRAPVLDNSTEMKALMGKKRAGEVSKEK